MSTAAGFEIARGYVTVLPETGGFARELSSQLGRMEPVRIPVQVDPGEVRRQVRDAGRQGEAEGEGGGRRIGQRLTAGLKVGLVGMGTVVAGVVGATLKSAFDSATTGQAQLQAAFGATAKEAQAAGSVAQQVFRNNFGESLADVQNTVGQIAQSMGGFGAVSQAELGKATEGALTIRDVFGVEVPETMRAASTMVKSGLVPDMTSAFDVITTGFQSGLNLGDDWIDTLNEYSGQFVKLGLTGPQSLSLIDAAMAAGAHNSDIAADALKEFSIRAIDGSESTAEGFRLAGLDADTMARRIAAGGASARDAFSETAKALGGIKDPVAYNTALVDLFGTQAEDLGPKVMAAMSESSAGVANLAGSTARAGEALYSTPQQRLSGFIRTIKADLIDYLGGTAVPALIRFGNGISPVFAGASHAMAPIKVAIAAVVAVVSGALGIYERNRTLINTLVVAVLAGTAAWYAYRGAVTAVTTAQWIWQTRTLLMGAATRAVTGGLALMRGGIMGVNAAMRANVIGIVITTIIALAAAFAYAYTHSESFRRIVDGALRWVGNTAQAVGRWFVGFGSDAMGVFRAVGSAAAAFGGFFVGIWRGSFDFVSSIVRGGLAIWRGAIDIGLGAILTGVKIWWTWFTLPFRVGFEVIRGLFSFWSAIFRGDWSGALDAIKSTTTRIFGLVSGAVGTALGGIKTIFSTTVGSIRTIWDGLREVAAAPVRFVVNTVYNSGIRKAWNNIVGRIPGVPDMPELKVPGLARGGPILEGTPGKDSVLRRLMFNEHVWTAKEVANAGGHRAMFALRRLFGGGGQARGTAMGIGGAITGGLGAAWDATGGRVVDKVEDLAREGIARGFELALSPLRAAINATLGTGTDLKGALGRLAQSPFDKLLDWVRGKEGESSAPGVGSRVQRWSGVASSVLNELGQSLSWLPLLLRRMNQESGGNQFAINKTDINARHGDPSRGLMQTIGSTFNAYAGKYISRGIYDPYANIYAATRYTLARYGSLSAWARPGGYAEGGLPPHGVPFWVGEEGPELMLLGRGAPRARVTPNDETGDGKRIVNNFYLDRSLSTPETLAEMQRKLALAVA